MVVLYTQLCNMFNTFVQSKQFQPTSSTEEINAIKNNMEILKGNQDTLSNKIKQMFKFVSLTYVESNTNRLLLSLLQKDIVQIHSTVHCLSKELKALILDRNFFTIMVQQRSTVATLCNGLHSFRVNILSIVNQISIISSQKLALALLSPCDLTTLPIKLESKLVSHPRLALPAYHGENILYMYKFMKLQFFITSDTLYTVLHIPFSTKHYNSTCFEFATSP